LDQRIGIYTAAPPSDFAPALAVASIQPRVGAGVRDGASQDDSDGYNVLMMLTIYPFPGAAGSGASGRIPGPFDTPDDQTPLFPVPGNAISNAPNARTHPPEVTLVYSLALDGPLTQEQRRQLQDAAACCPVRRTLTGILACRE